MIAVVPMAGRGSRYSQRGYDTPKPLVKIFEKPMILWAVQSLQGLRISRYVFIVLQQHEDVFGVSDLLSKNINARIEFVFLRDITEGQLCTVLAAKHLLGREEDILIAASDSLVIGNLQSEIDRCCWQGIISVANLPGEQWSFAKLNNKGEVTEVAEKRRISDYASTGSYYFRSAGDLIDYGEEMILQGEKTRGEYYIIPVYQKMIDAGLKVGISEAEAMWDLGSPESKAFFEKNYFKK